MEPAETVAGPQQSGGRRTKKAALAACVAAVIAIAGVGAHFLLPRAPIATPELVAQEFLTAAQANDQTRIKGLIVANSRNRVDRPMPSMGLRVEYKVRKAEIRGSEAVVPVAVTAKTFSGLQMYDLGLFMVKEDSQWRIDPLRTVKAVEQRADGFKRTGVLDFGQLPGFGSLPGMRGLPWLKLPPRR
jgi:hypothetical protein